MKAKKATAGEKYWMKWLGQTYEDAFADEGRRDDARDIDRLIARERRKERKRIVADLVSCLNCQDNQTLYEFLGGIIDRIRNGGQR